MFREKKARSRVIEKKPPMAAINLGTDVDGGEKIETSRKDKYQKMRLGYPAVSCKGGVKIQAQPNA